MKEKQIGIILSLILVAGLLLRIYGLSHHAFWFDEILCINNSSVPLFNIPFATQYSPPLYYIILHYWMKIFVCFHNNELYFRLLSFIFGTAGILAIFVIVRKLFNDIPLAFTISILMAVSPFHVIYSQELRMYTLLPLLSILSTYFYYLLLQKYETKHLAGYLFSSILMLYTHIWGVFLIISHLLFFLVTYKKWGIILKKYFYMMLTIFVCYLPAAYFTLYNFQSKKGGTSFLAKPDFQTIKDVLFAFSGTGFGMGDSNIHLERTPADLGSLIFLVLFVLGVYWTIKLRNEKNYLLLCSVFITLLMPFLVSFKSPLFKPARYTIIIFPQFLILVGYGFNKIKQNTVKIIVCVLVLTLNAALLHKYYFNWTKSYSVQLLNYLNNEYQQNDLVYFADFGDKLCTNYYLETTLSKKLDIVELNQIQDKLKKNARIFITKPETEYSWNTEADYTKIIPLLKEVNTTKIGKKIVTTYVRKNQ
jgi:uncharacterized membrane protein